LPSGEYTFEVKSINANGVESKEIARFPFSIKKHFTETVWFFMTLLFSILLLFFVVLNYFEKRRTAKILTEKKYAMLEMKALQSQMNPHFIFNSLSAIQSVMFLKGEKETNKYIGAFSKLMRITLDNSKKSFISLENEIEYLKSYIDLEERRLNNNIEVSFNVSEDINPEEIQIPCMIFQPLIENAIIHGLIPKKGTKKLTINFYLENNVLIGEIIDNGIGRKASEKNAKNKNYKSWASTILKEKVDVLNKMNKEKVVYKIVDLMENNKATGTKVIIKLPVQ